MASARASVNRSDPQWGSRRIPLPLQGRGTSFNPPNRFEPIELEPCDDDAPTPDPELTASNRSGGPKTLYFRDLSRSIIVFNDSPDIGFDASINPYRGCEHGCAYCYARPYHEYLGLSAGLDFESKIFCKLNADKLLRAELSSRSWQPRVLALCGVTDAYQPVERRLGLTRACLGVLAEFRNPVGIVTKNHLVTRDIDLLQELSRFHAAAVHISLTTLNNDLASRMEPRASAPMRRLEAIRRLADAAVPVGVLIAPVIPGLTDHELPSLLRAAADAGARWAGTISLRLPGAVQTVFLRWLEEHYPQRRNKIIHQIQSMHEGRLNDPRFHNRFRTTGALAGQINDLFHTMRQKLHLACRAPTLSVEHFRVPGGQPGLFD
ncbi:MAG: PA0069 family radical SAM protein [Phycisphaerales bacterium]|nr:PA0069 family radical SAM protein [Phycisphaerales bacterium]